MPERRQRHALATRERSAKAVLRRRRRRRMPHAASAAPDVLLCHMPV